MRLLISALLFSFLLCGVFGTRGWAAPAVGFQHTGELNDRSFLEQLEAFQSNAASPYEEVLPGSWAYENVKHLADAGLLNGYTGDQVLNGQPITRYEMGAIVSRMTDNYLEWAKTGKVRILQPLAAPANTMPVAGPPQAVVALPADPGPAVVPIQRTPGGLVRRGPTQMDGGPAAPPTKPTVISPDDKNTPPKNPTVAPPPATQPTDGVSFVEVEKRITLTEKDIASLQKLVNNFKNELKDLNKNLRKDIQEGKKISLQNQRQIKALQDENERFRMTGSNLFTWSDGGPYHDEYYWMDQEATQTVVFNDSLTLNISSKPTPNDSIRFNASFNSNLDLAGDFSGSGNMLYGGSSALTLKSISAAYDSPPESGARHFKLRNMVVGNTSILYSPLTVFGKNVTGVSAAFGLGKYSFSVFGARTAKHPYWLMPRSLDVFVGGVASGSLTVPISPPPFSAAMGVPYVQYDQYLYGLNINFPLFNNPQSMANISKIFMMDNRRTNFPGCQGRTGFWINLPSYNDPFAPIGVNSDPTFQDIFCLPPEKNSVESFFVRHPLVTGKMGNIFLTGEYGHSTYFREGYKAVFKPEATVCDPNDPKNLISGCNVDVPERNTQDDAFLVLFDYNKGPIKIFPVGFVRLGPQFVTKNFGLPGFDMGAFNLSLLPINLQSMQLFVASFAYDGSQKHNFKYSNLYAAGGEIKPMYFDPGALAKMESNMESKGTMEVLMRVIDNLNNRREKLHLSAWNNTFTWFMSPKMTLDANFMRVHAWLPPGCLDSDITEIRDNQGNVITRYWGNGLLECGLPGATDKIVKLDLAYLTQKYGLTWNTSKNTTLKFGFGLTNMVLNFDLGTDAANSAIRNLVPHGLYYTLDNQIEVKLTPSTTMNIGYTSSYDRMPVSDDRDKYPVIDTRTVNLGVTTTF